MKTIPLSQGLIALVDDADHEELSQYRWYAHKGYSTVYAVRNVQIDGKRSMTYMHRVIMGDAATGLSVDHRDRDGLNNPRTNLRSCTNAENQRNQATRANSTTGFKGVTIQKKCVHNPYKAQIYTNKRFKYLGSYPTPEQAHAAYCAAAVELHGEFARLA